MEKRGKSKSSLYRLLSLPSTKVAYSSESIESRKVFWSTLSIFAVYQICHLDHLLCLQRGPKKWGFHIISEWKMKHLKKVATLAFQSPSFVTSLRGGGRKWTFASSIYPGFYAVGKNCTNLSQPRLLFSFLLPELVVYLTLSSPLIYDQPLVIPGL